MTRFHPFLPPWTELDPELHARLSARRSTPSARLLAALERIVPLGGKRVADIGTGIGHYPLLLARRTGRTYGIESDPGLLDEARAAGRGARTSRTSASSPARPATDSRCATVRSTSC